MTYATKIAGTSHNIRFFVEIDGIPVRFSESWMDLSDVLSDSTAQFEMPSIIPGSISPGFGRLDRDARQQIGGTFSFRVRDLGFAYSNSKTETTFYALDSYIRPAARETTTITATKTETDTAISVLSGVDIANGDFLYIGQETIAVKTGGGTASLTVGRGGFSSIARRLYREGGATSLFGQKVYKYPQSWRGRRVRLRGAYVASDGTTTSADIATVGTWVLAGPPQYMGDDEWEFQCEDIGSLIQSFRCYVGLGEVQRAPNSSEDEIVRPDSGGEFFLARVHVGKNVDYFQTSSTQRMDVQYWNDRDGIGVVRLGAVDTGNENIELEYSQAQNRVAALEPSQLAVSGVPSATGDYAPCTIQKVRPVQYLAGPPGEIALMLITSVEGNGDNGTWDQLAGNEPDTLYENGWQFGAGVPSDYVNAASFLERSRYAIAPWTLLLDRPVDVAKILSEFCVATGSYWYINSDGEIAVAALSEFSDPATSSALTVDDSVVLRETSDAVGLDESLITPHASFRGGFDPIVGEHMLTGAITDWELFSRYPYCHGEMRIEMDWIHPVVNGFAAKSNLRLKVASAADAFTVYYRINRLQRLRGRGVITHEAICSWAASQIVAGQTVTIENANAVDYEGNRLSASISANQRRFLVMEKRLDPERGSVRLSLHKLASAVVWAPAWEITSISSLDVTVSTTHESTADEASPITNHMVDGMSVAVWDVSGAAWLSRTVSALVDADTFTISSTTSVAVGDIVTVESYSSASDGATAAGYDIKDDVAWQAGGTPADLGSGDAPKRWA